MLGAVVALTGASALALQVAWQRVIALRSGVDLVATTVTLAAFLTGLGLGSALGGRIADRLGRRASATWFAAANLVVAVLAAISVPVFLSLVPSGLGPVPAFVVTFALVVAPTLLMGATLPLLARAVVPEASRAGPVVGRLVAANTFGGALGAFVAGWYVVGTFGLAGATRVAALGYAVAAAGAWVVLRGDVLDAVPAESATDRGADTVSGATDTRDAPVPGRVWPWLVVIFTTGAVALGLETVCFRVIDALMRSNSYSFPWVLGTWLSLLAAGAAVGSGVVGRVRSARRWFLGAQLGVAVATAATFVVVVRLTPSTPLAGFLERWMNSDGLAGGFGEVSTTDAAVAAIVLPLVLIAAPVFLMGFALPFAQRLVTRDLATLGWRTGALGAAQLAGNVAGSLVVGLVLMDAFGSGTTARVLVGALLVAVVVAWAAPRSDAEPDDSRADGPARSRRPSWVAGVAVFVGIALVAAMPSTNQLWSFLHDADQVTLLVEDDRTCGTVVKAFGDTQAQLHINGASQNGFPFDDFHVLVGLTPALVADRPSDVTVIGLGAGSTTYGVLLDPQVDAVTSVELCGGIERLLRRLATPARPQLEGLFSDPRATFVTDDGRAVLAATEPDSLDVVVSDTMRTTSAASGNTFSVEYFEQIRDRLTPDGVMAIWIPNGRVLASLQQVFDDVAVVTVGEYNGSRFAVAGRAPLDLDLTRLRQRFDASSVPDADRDRYWSVISTISDVCDPTLPPPIEFELNRDLEPRDEYFVNNGGIGLPDRPRCADPPG